MHDSRLHAESSHSHSAANGIRELCGSEGSTEAGEYRRFMTSSRYLGAQDLVEEGILVSLRMMADHMPDYLTAVLRRMAQDRSVTPNALLRQVSTSTGGS